MPLPFRATSLVACLVLGGCTGREAVEPLPAPAPPWTVPAAGTDSPLAEACDACAATSCETEQRACDGACQVAYLAWTECMFPNGGEWSGFSRGTCRALASVDDARAEALIECVVRDCSDTGACGDEPHAVYGAPLRAGQDFSAASFLERYCNGCHNPGFVPPPGKWVTSFSTDYGWEQPYGSTEWYVTSDYAAATSRAAVILCGVFPGELPLGCETEPTVAEGFFQGPEKFPPTAATKPPSYGVEGAPMCEWGDDEGHCPQPTELERRRMVSWIYDGMPRE